MAASVEVELIDETGQAAAYLTLLRRVAERAVASEGLRGAYALTVTVTDDEAVRELNRLHRGKDAVTDVLSFPLVGDDPAAFVLPPGVPTPLGDVVVAFERCREQAREYGHAFERELAYLVTHGVLHLLGHDHEDEEQRLLMRAREEEVLVDLPR